MSVRFLLPISALLRLYEFHKEQRSNLCLVVNNDFVGFKLHPLPAESVKGMTALRYRRGVQLLKGVKLIPLAVVLRGA